jgi:cell division septum initiation protein DivIVA
LTDQALRRVDALLTELVELVETARAVPMSASCVLPREHVLNLLDDLREVLPGEMDEARRISVARDTVLTEAKANAERITEDAQRAADTMLAAASSQSEALHAEADDYRREATGTAQMQAHELVEGARAEHLRLVTATDVHQAAVATAQGLRREADEYDAATRAAADRYRAASEFEAERAATALRQDAERYAEQTLTELAEVLTRAVATTEHGRQELVRRRNGAIPGA